MDTTQAALIGLIGACITALVWIIKFQSSKILTAIENNTNVMAKLSSVTEKNTKATEHADKYLRERNGRDNDVHTYLLGSLKDVRVATLALPEQMQKIADASVGAVAEAMQHIEYQKVDKQVVRDVK